jgi:hypothetical protein
MFSRRSIISSTAARRVVGVRRLADAPNPTTGPTAPRGMPTGNVGAMPGADAADTQAQQTARNNPQMLLGLGVGAATAMWIASVLCREKSSDDRVSYSKEQYPTRVDPPRSDLELRGKPGQEQSKSGRAW